MKYTSLNINFTNEATNEIDALAVFKHHGTKVGTGEIKKGMSTDEIAEVVSDKLILVIKTQFENAKKVFEHTNTTK